MWRCLPVLFLLSDHDQLLCNDDWWLFSALFLSFLLSSSSRLSSEREHKREFIGIILINWVHKFRSSLFHSLIHSTQSLILGSFIHVRTQTNCQYAFSTFVHAYAGLPTRLMNGWNWNLCTLADFWEFLVLRRFLCTQNSWISFG